VLRGGKTVFIGYLRVVARRWYILVILLVLSLLVLVGVLTLFQQATARVIVPFPSQQTNSNFQNVATSYAVANQVIHDMNLHTNPTSLLNKVTVSLEYQSNVYDINVRDTNANRAIAIAQRWTQDTIALYTELNTAADSQAYQKAQQQLSGVESRILNLQKQLVAFEYQHPELVNTQITSNQTGSSSTSSSQSSSSQSSSSGSSGTGQSVNVSVQSTPQPGIGNTTTTTIGPTSSSNSSSSTSSSSVTGSSSQHSSSSTVTTTNNTPGRASDAEALAMLKQQLADAQAIYDQMNAVVGSQQGASLNNASLNTPVILDPAHIPPPNWLLLVPFTILLALLLGIGIIFGVEYFDQRIYNPDAIEKVLNAPVIVAAPLKTKKQPRQLSGATAGGWRPGLPEPDRSMYWRDNG
jgi:capsular polysaccharide biosynthesis protein